MPKINNVAPEVRANDMDRMLLDCDALTLGLVAIAADFSGIDGTALLRAKEATEAVKRSFDTLDAMRQQGVDEATIAGIRESFATIDDGEQYLYPDALPYLDTLDREGTANFTLTYGGSDTQLMKLRATGLDKRPYLITQQKQKGVLIAESRNPHDGTYRFELTSGGLLVAETVVLVDDKAVSFEGLPEDCSGYRVVRPEEPLLPGQVGEVPGHVETIASLDEISELLAA